MIAQSFLPEFDHEFATARTHLERVPEDQPDFQAHEKSMTLSKLAGHVAEIATWVNVTMDTDELDFATSEHTPFVMTTREDLLATFDKNIAAAREALAAASDETMMSSWTMRSGDEIYMTIPKVAVVRTWVLNHMIHHRAQLGVYLRLLGVPVPASYGPSADEGDM
jgi:uncharacterized damage-inducible protein DinB